MSIATLKQLSAQATAGPWEWWTSNSFRRLSSVATGKDGDVLYACIQLSDGHPDIGGSDADMALIAAMRNNIDALIAVAEAAQEFVAVQSTAEVDWEAYVTLRAALARLDA